MNDKMQGDAGARLDLDGPVRRFVLAFHLAGRRVPPYIHLPSTPEDAPRTPSATTRD